jgi:hypothetical protein
VTTLSCYCGVQNLVSGFNCSLIDFFFLSPDRILDLVNNLIKREIRIVSRLNMAPEVQGVLTAAVLGVHLLRAKP